MRLTNVGRTITLEHTPGMHWFLGGLLIVVGLVGLAAPVGMAADAGTLQAWERVAVAAAGVTALLAGGWVCWRAPRTQAVLDLAKGVGRIEHNGIGVRETIEFPLEGVDEVVLDHGKDDDGGDVYRPALRMRDGRMVLLSPVWMHHGPQDTVQALGRALDRPVARPALTR